MIISRSIHIAANGIISFFFLWLNNVPLIGLPGNSVVKQSTCQCRRCRFNPWIGKIPQRRKWQPTPVFLPGKSHGQRSLAGYSPWGHKRVRNNLAAKQQQQKFHRISMPHFFTHSSVHGHSSSLHILAIINCFSEHWGAYIFSSYDFSLDICPGVWL